MLATTPHRGALGLGVRTLLVLWLASLLGTARAESSPADAPENHGFSPERLARIDTPMQAAVEAGKMVGALGLIARDGKVIYRSQWGKANRETGPTHNGRDHLPLVLHEQAHHLRRAHDALRGRALRPK